jgi:hypothetical protein
MSRRTISKDAQELWRLKSVREQQLRNFKLQGAGFAGKSLK